MSNDRDLVLRGERRRHLEVEGTPRRLRGMREVIRDQEDTWGRPPGETMGVRATGNRHDVPFWERLGEEAQMTPWAGNHLPVLVPYTLVSQKVRPSLFSRAHLLAAHGPTSILTSLCFT